MMRLRPNADAPPPPSSASASSASLSTSAFKALVDTLENVDSPLGALCDALWSPTSSFSSSSQLSIGVTIAALLQDDLLPQPPQRLVAIYILYDMIVARQPLANFSSAIQRLVDSPLTIILFELADDSEHRLREQLFLSHLLTHSQAAGNDARSAVPAQISQAPPATLWNALEGAMRSGAAVPKLNISSLRTLWTARHPDKRQFSSLTEQPSATLPHTSTLNSSTNNPASSSHLTSEQQQQQHWQQQTQQQQQELKFEQLEYPNSHRLPPVSGVILDSDPYSTPEPGHLFDDLGSVVTLEDFTPAFVRIPPPILPISELRWVDPEPLHQVIWDPDMGVRSNSAVAADLRDIVSRALKSPIPESLQMRVVTHLDAHPKLVHSCGLSPRKLPELVENNSTLATKILFKLASSKQMPQYLDALGSMDINLHSMEVVTRLSGLVGLPTEFLHSYINKCIRSCNNIPDKYSKVRMVRFVCMFLKNLMKNKAVDLQNLNVEVQGFCIEYSRIREVADLFRSLKNYGPQQQ